MITLSQKTWGRILFHTLEALCSKQEVEETTGRSNSHSLVSLHLNAYWALRLSSQVLVKTPTRSIRCILLTELCYLTTKQETTKSKG